MQIKPLKQQLLTSRHRALLVIAGSWDWGLQQLADLTDDTPGFWLGDLPPDGWPNITALNHKQTLQRLGQECEQLIINGFCGIDLNALGAITGTLKAGGIAYLLCPELNKWSQQADPQNQHFCVYPHNEDDPSRLPNRLIQHFVDTIKADPNIILISQFTSITDHKEPRQKPQLNQSNESNDFSHPVYKTEQQQIGVEKIKKVATGHRRRPLVLTADRGRGKSSALGLAVAELLLAGKKHMIVSAPQVASVSMVFARAAEQLTVIEQSATKLVTTQGILQFIAPDELVRHKYTADLVMIDEAAAIPAPMLTQLLKHYARIVFTSTIHGYEGTGRGFEIRFKHTLNQLTPDWQAYNVSQPIRWAANDPLEQFINQALMLNAQAADHVVMAKAKFKLWDRDQLLADAEALLQIVGLLTLAHYKTSPNDFRHLLDGSNIQLYTLSMNQAIVGTALVAIEGQLPDELCRPIWQGERRPRGHLLPQTLSCHAGFIDAPKYSYARVSRIAIHPELQTQGLGSQLLQQLQSQLQQQNIDFIGSSFGATTGLLAFWQQNGMRVVRLGLTVEATSNEYSAVILKPLTAPAKTLLRTMQHKFDDDLPHLLVEFYSLLPEALVLRLLQQRCADRLPPLTAQDLAELESYIKHQREYEFCSPLLFKYSLLAIAQGRTTTLDQQQQQLLVNKVLRRLPWSQICQQMDFVGKKAAATALKALFGQLTS